MLYVVLCFQRIPRYYSSVLASLFQHGDPHAVNLGRYAVLQATTLSFEQRSGEKSSNIIYSTFTNAIYRGVTWRSNTIWLGQLYMEPGWGGEGGVEMGFSIPIKFPSDCGGGGAKWAGAAGFTATL